MGNLGGASSQPSGSQGAPGRSVAELTRRRRPDLALAAVVALGVLLVHDVGYVLHHAYWLDEAWVADSTRVPLSDLPQVTAVTPVGFSLLLRVAVVGGDQRHRLVPLAFAGATLSMAYLSGRELGLRRSVSILLLALPALFVPAMLVRDDLKPYTAEAFGAVLVLLLLLHLEARWSRRRLLALALVVGLGPLVSNADLFIGSAALLAVAASTLFERRWSRLREVVLAGAGAALLMGGTLVAFVLPKQNAELRHYWDAYYPPGDPSAAWGFLLARLQAMAPTTGLGSVPLVLVGCSLGTAALLLRRRRSSALLLPLAFGELVLASALHLFPLLDLRTSTWLAVLAVVLTGLGLAQVVERAAVGRRGVAVVLAALGGGVFAVANTGHVRDHLIPDEDVRAQARYVQLHQRPGDVVIVDLTASFGYGYYRGTNPLPIIDSGAVSATGFLVRYDDPAVVAMHARDRAAPGEALQEAARRLGPHGRVFVVRSHLSSPEAAGWQQALAGCQVTTLRVGIEPLLILQGAP